MLSGTVHYKETLKSDFSLSQYYNYREIFTHLKPFKPPRCIKASFYIPENTSNIPTTRGFRTKIPM